MFQVQVKSSNGIHEMSADSCLFTDRKVFIEGEINAASACDFVRRIMLLNREDGRKPINVYVCSGGGEVTAGLLMYDVIQSSKAPIRMFCLGRVSSMAAILFAGGNHGRYILPHGEIMIHEPLIGGGLGGSASSIKSISDSLIKTRSITNGILAKHTGKTEAEIDQATSYDHYFTAEESIEFGLCDEIVSFEQMMET